MQTNKKRVVLMIPLPLIFLLFGCQIPKGPVKVIFPPEPATAPPSGSAARRFQESAPKAQTAVESAVELSEKYARLSEQAAAIQQRNEELIAENDRIKELLDSSQEQLRQTQKELAEANDLLIEMRIELNNWKTNVLGFRDEMRDAEKAQLEALFKVLNVLGAKVKPESAQDQQQPSLEQSPQQLSQAQPEEILTSGLSNE
jgi:chromosome segregation ATPase